MDKVCTKCKKKLSLDNFRKDSSKKDGYYSSCNDCYRKIRGIKKMIPAKTHICPGCGIEFKPRINQFDNQGDIYCNVDCRMNHIKRKSYYHGYHEYIKERDGNKCVVTGDTENLHVHHIITRGAGGGNDYRNLITLSAKTHIEKGHGIDSGKYRKIFLDYTSKFDIPEYWEEVMKKSKEDDEKIKKKNNERAKEYYKKLKNSQKFKDYNKKRNEERNKKYKEKYNKNYHKYIKDFKKEFGMSPTQYKYKKQKEYLKTLPY